ncbi:hypothetical protein SprV_0301266900 [Sparganum proliferum]
MKYNPSDPKYLDFRASFESIIPSTNVAEEEQFNIRNTAVAVQQLSSRRAPESEAIPPEIYKHGAPTHGSSDGAHLGAVTLRRSPQNFKYIAIVHLQKRKGDRPIFNNHWGISLLNIVGEILARILLSRLSNHVEQGFLRESQCSFCRHCDTTDMIFAAC